MFRKLLFSTIGSFWSNKGTMSVATALLLSVVFLVVQHRYTPFKSSACNRTQECCLCALSLLYFAGLLLKVDAVGASEQESLGDMLVALLVMVFAMVLAVIVNEVYSLAKAVQVARHCAVVLRLLPRTDPEPDSKDFYLIQIPVEKDNMGHKFTLKLPEELQHISNEEKLVVVRLLSSENQTRLENFFTQISTSWTVPLQVVKSSAEVDGGGKIAVKYSRKTEQSILAKACRPAILAKSPRFSVEHVRDTFRFKCVCYSFRDLLKFVYVMDDDQTLFPHRLCSSCVAKLDVDKLREPKEWGWRFVALDLIMPNRQIVECYIVFTEMEFAKKAPAPDAKVCADLSNHEIFEKWRVVDTKCLAPDRRVEYEQDMAESNRRYNAAYQTVLSHTSHQEQSVFWNAFCTQQGDGGAHATSNGPLDNADKPHLHLPEQHEQAISIVEAYPHSEESGHDRAPAAASSALTASFGKISRVFQLPGRPRRGMQTDVSQEGEAVRNASHGSGSGPSPKQWAENPIAPGRRESFVVARISDSQSNVLSGLEEAHI